MDEKLLSEQGSKVERTSSPFSPFCICNWCQSSSLSDRRFIDEARRVALESQCVSCAVMIACSEMLVSADRLKHARLHWSSLENALFRLDLPQSSDEREETVLLEVYHTKSDLSHFLFRSNRWISGCYGVNESYKTAETPPNLLEELFPAKRHLPGRTNSDSSFDAVKIFLEDCGKSHTKCRPLSSAVPFPRRILDLRHQQVVLGEHLSPEYGKDAIYACLSHCWGDSNGVPKTTSDNVDLHKIEISEERLSQTFREAIQICLRLDINYLWIDSLCILQDSEEDWARESTSMGDTYANAFVTIAASWSRGGPSGRIFSEALNFRLAKPVNGYMGLYVRPKLHSLTVWSHYEGDFNPLTSRAWAYQERLLSRRILHFTRNEIIAECRQECWSESGDNDNILTDREDANKYFCDTNLKIPQDVNTTNGQKKRSIDTDMRTLEHNDDIWRFSIVSNYSELQLSKESDRLAALAALASRLAMHRPGDRYLAGLWERSVIQGLLWYAQSYIERPVGELPSPKHRPPTWSWAATQKAVEWQNIKLDEIQRNGLVEVESVDCQHLGPPYLGRLHVGASITLTAHYLKSENTYPTAITFPTPLCESLIVWEQQFHPDKEPNYAQDYEGMFYFIPFSGVGEDSSAIVGLVLEETREQGKFLRLGLHVWYTKYQSPKAPNITMDYRSSKEISDRLINDELLSWFKSQNKRSFTIL